MKINAKKVSKMMLRFKASGDEETLREIFKALDSVIYQQSMTKMGQCNSGLNTLEDFKIMSQQIIWKAIMDYKFICPCCGIKAKTEKAYRIHMEEKHNCNKKVNGKTVKMAIPYSNIYFFVVKVLVNMLSNVVRDEYKIKRMANSNNFKEMAIAPYSDSEQISDVFDTIESTENTEELVISKDIIQSLMEKVELEGNKVHLFLLKGLMQGYTKTVLAQSMANAGLYKNVNSAKCSLSRAIKDLQTMYLDIAK
jgi:hypothetical protein